MIKLHSAGIASDYTEHGSVSTDCRTVGEFMTEAAAVYGGKLTIKVDGCRYEIYDIPKLRVTDDTPIDEITYASTPGSMTFNILTKPKPKTVKRSGWINIYKTGEERFIDGLFKSKEEADKAVGISDVFHIATVRIEWEEVEK